MRLFLCAALLLAGGWPSPGLAQQAAPDAPAPARPVYKPVWLLDYQVIIGENELSVIKPGEIKKIDIYKANNIPAKWRGLAEHGIVALTMKHRVKLKTTTLSSLSRWLHLAGPVRFKLDGLPLEDPALRIALAGIAGLDVTRATPTAPGTVVDIRLVRTGPTPPPPGPVVPGQPLRILIRGTAGL
ncbi:MAG: hypothetical protein EOO36_13715 [Cytophagaceae bacterium]|nr:MAG: hypothetical protein EOO36_13715 [Cytophagaceae bacterium]